MKKWIARALLSVGVGLCGTVYAEVDTMAPWPMACHDLRHTSRAPFVGPQSLKVKWTYQAVGSTMWGPVVGRDGTIYTPATDGNLYAVNPDGTLKWQFNLGGGGSQHATIGDDGTIYATGKSLYALAPDGTAKWHFDAAGLDKNQTPTFGPNNLIYQTSTDGTLYVIDAKTGKQQWSHQYIAGQRIQAPIAFALDGDPVISYRVGGVPNVFKTDQSGNILWMFTGPDQMRSATIGDDGTIYVADAINTGVLYALDPATGAMKWSQAVRDAGTVDVEFPSLGLDGTVYVGSQDGELAAFSPKGDVAWKFENDQYDPIDPVLKTPVLAAMATPIVDSVGNLFVPSLTSDLWEVDKNGKLLAHLPTPEGLFSRMAMGADGTIYTGSIDGTLYAFGDDVIVGDHYGEGHVSIKDAVLALQKAVKLSPVTPQDLRTLDVNPSSGNGRPYGDGEITIADAISLLEQVVAPRPNWPFPNAAP